MKFACIFFLLLIAHSCICAQGAQVNDTSETAPVTKEKTHRPLSIDISFFNHSVSSPFHKIVSRPVHPGVQVGIEGKYVETPKSKLFETLNLGMFYNNYNGTGLYLNSEIAYRYTSKPGIFAEANAGVGYLRTYHPTDIYELNSFGNYEKAKDKGFSSPIVSFAFGLGYAIKSSSSFSFAPFVRYESIIQTKYSSDLKILPQSAVHVGVRINKKRR